MTTSNGKSTVAVIANFDEQGDAQYRAWCFDCTTYLSNDKRWATRAPATTAAGKHLSKDHGVEEPSFAPATQRPSDVKVGEVK